MNGFTFCTNFYVYLSIFFSFRFVGDCQIPLACSMFIEEHGRTILSKSLYKNFILHMCNLFDYGLISASVVYHTMHQLNQLRDELENRKCLSWSLQPFTLIVIIINFFTRVLSIFFLPVFLITGYFLIIQSRNCLFITEVQADIRICIIFITSRMFFLFLPSPSKL